MGVEQVTTAPAWQLGDREDLPLGVRRYPRGIESPAPIRCRTATAGSLALVEPMSDRGAGDGRTLRGTFSVYNQWQEIRSASEGHFLELIRGGTFAKTIQERGQRIPVLYSHGRDPAIGTQVLGKILNLAEDERGAHYQVELFSGIPELLLEGLRSGHYGSSFRAQIVKETFDPRPRKSAHNPQGLPESVVSELKLLDIGPTSLPAYGATSAQVRGAEVSNNVRHLNIAPRPYWEIVREDDEEPSWLLQRKDRDALASTRT
jgi:phage head maturation protease